MRDEATNSFSDNEVLTDNITYTANCWKLTAIQWRIINSNNYFNIISIAILGSIVSIAIDLIPILERGDTVNWSDIKKLLYAFLILIISFILSFLFNRKKRLIIKGINKRLLADTELGISVPVKRWGLF